MRRLLVAVTCVGLLAPLPALAERGGHHQLNLKGHGISITLPPTWQGRIYKRTGGLPILHAGNFTLPRGNDDVGTNAIKKMRRSSVFIVLLESEGTGGAPFRRLTGPPQVRRSDFLAMFKGIPHSHAFARVLFTTRHRYFQLWVQFGVRPAPARLLGDANRVLATLRVTAS